MQCVFRIMHFPCFFIFIYEPVQNVQKFYVNQNAFIWERKLHMSELVGLCSVTGDC